MNTITTLIKSVSSKVVSFAKFIGIYTVTAATLFFSFLISNMINPFVVVPAIIIAAFTGGIASAVVIIVNLSLGEALVDAFFQTLRGYRASTIYA